MVTLNELTIIQAPIERVFDLARSIDVHLISASDTGEQTIAMGGLTTGLMGLGDVVTWQARHFGIRQRLTSRITRFDPPHAFQDTMLRGAFAHMQHDHFFRALPDGATAMRDVFRFAAPIPILGRIADHLILARYMRGFLRERNQTIKQVAESRDWKRYLPMQKGGPGNHTRSASKP
jgi:ligand-binding SRPBCC domain-containing protein